MRILHVLPNSGEGGVQRTVAILVTAQRDAGHEVAVAGTAGPLRSLFAEPWFDIPAVTTRLVDLARAVGACRKIIRSWRPDVVHGHTARLAPVLSVATGGGRWPGAVISAHGMPADAVRASALALRASRLAVIAVGPGLAAAFRQHGLRCHMIPNGISPPPPPVSRSSLRAEWGIPDCMSLAVAVGRLVPQKNHLCAIRALPSAPDVVLAILGEGPLREELAAEAERLGVSKRLRLVGFRPDAREVMAAADIVVMPSVWEGLPIAGVEALSSGTPLVAAAAPGLEDWLTDGRDARLVPPDEPAALACALQDVVRDPELAARLSAGARETAEHYTAEAMVDKHMRLYAEVAARSWAAVGGRA